MNIYRATRIISAFFTLSVITGLLYLDPMTSKMLYLYELLGASISVMVTVYGIYGIEETT